MMAFGLGSLSRGDLFHDPDTLMRLALVKAMHAQGWQHGFFARDDAPFGMVFHWSGLFSWVLMGAADLLWFLPFERALAIVGVVTGPVITLGCVAVAYRGARPLLSPVFAGVYALSVACEASVLIYGRTGTANHHILLLLVALCLLNAAIRLDRRAQRYGTALWAGIGAGLGVWISFELVPFVELFCAYLFLLWILEGGSQRSANLLYVATPLCGVALLGLWIDPPYGGYGSRALDRVSLAYVLALALQLAAVLLCRAVRPCGRWRRLGCLCALTAASVVVEVLVFPETKAGPLAQINPFVRDEEIPVLGEMMPIQSTPEVFFFLGNGILGAVLLTLIARIPSWRQWTYLAVLAGLGVAAQAHMRMSPYFWTGGSLASFYYLQDRRRSSPVPDRRLNAQIFWTSLCLVAGNVVLGEYFYINSFHPYLYKQADCEMSHVLPSLRNRSFLDSTEAAPIFVTAFDQTPRFLFTTDYRALAGAYHTDARGINDMYLMMRDMGSNLAHGVVQDHGISYLLLCPTSDRDRFGVTSTALYRKYSNPAKEFHGSQPSTRGSWTATCRRGWNSGNGRRG